jgi:hypothetical protein
LAFEPNALILRDSGLSPESNLTYRLPTLLNHCDETGAAQKDGAAAQRTTGQ